MQRLFALARMEDRLPFFDDLDAAVARGLTPLAGGTPGACAPRSRPRPFSRGAIAGSRPCSRSGCSRSSAGEEVLVAALLVLPPQVVALTGALGRHAAGRGARAGRRAGRCRCSGDAIQLADRDRPRARRRHRRRRGRGRARRAPRSRSSASGCWSASPTWPTARAAHDELVEGVLDLLVPALGDVADRRRHPRRRAPPDRHARRAPGSTRRWAARWQGGGPSSGEERSSEASMAADEARLVHPDGALLAAAARSPRDEELLRGAAHHHRADRAAARPRTGDRCRQRRLRPVPPAPRRGRAALRRDARRARRARARQRRARPASFEHRTPARQILLDGRRRDHGEGRRGPVSMPTRPRSTCSRLSAAPCTGRRPAS